MVEGEVRVAVGGLWVVSAEYSFLNNDALSLKIDCLQEVSKLELN